MAIQRLACLSCGGNSFTRDAENHLVCDHCGSVFRTQEHVCPTCQAINPPHALHCNQCGTRLTRRCKVCEHENPGNAEYCADCGNPLDILEYITQRYREEGAQGREELVKAKRIDAAYVGEQGVRLREEEREWRSGIAAQQVEQQRQQRILFMVIVGGAVATLLICGVLVALSSLPGG